jgi:hypothetical protein
MVQIGNYCENPPAGQLAGSLELLTLSGLDQPTRRAFKA